MASKPVDFNRDDLAKLQGISPRTLRAFENINVNQDEIVANLGDIRASPILGLTNSDIFSVDRALTGSADILLTDGGPKGNLSISLTTSGVSASTYGSASKVPAFSVDTKGRITMAAQYNLVSDNVAEGTVNLYFTQARARASVSNGSGLDYNSATGVFSVHAAGIYGVPTGTLTRASFATYSAPTVSNPPTQAEVQALADHVQVLSRTLAALITDMQANGNLS